MKNDKTYLTHILQAIERLEHYIGNSTYKQFCDNEMMVAATVRELEIIGEASNNLSQQFHDRHAGATLRDATDMRNFLIHEYFGVNTKVVWDTCKNDVPVIKSFIERASSE